MLRTTASEMQAALGLVDALVQAEYEYGNVPGLCAGVVSDQDLVWSKGYGYAHLGEGIPATPDTLWSVASITKLFTATMLMQLRDQGGLQLDDPIHRYIPALTLCSAGPDPRPITFRQAASHTAGLVKEAPFLYWHTFQFPTIQEVLEKLSQREVGLPALTEFKYSNLGYMLIGYACERIAGEPYVDYQEAKILSPLGMDSSGFESSPEVRARSATHYTPTEDGHGWQRVPVCNEGALLYAGGLYSSVTDLSRFISLQFQDRPVGGNQILGGTTLREMRSPVFMRPGWKRGVGIGWWLGIVDDWVYIGHMGSDAGLDCAMIFVPEVKLGMVVLANTNIDTRGLCEQALKVLVPVARRIAAHREGAYAAPTSPEWEMYCGRYRSDRGIVVIEMVSGRLQSRFEGDPGEVSVFTIEGEHEFRVHGGYWSGELVRFEVARAGTIAALQADGGLWVRT